MFNTIMFTVFWIFYYYIYNRSAYSRCRISKPSVKATEAIQDKNYPGLRIPLNFQMSGLNKIIFHPKRVKQRKLKDDSEGLVF